MVKASRTLRRVIRKTRWPWKKLKIFVKGRLGWLGTPKLLPYTGYSNGKEVVVSGSVTEDRGLAKPREGQSLWQNILTMIKRYEGDAFAGIKVRIDFNGQQIETETDEEGNFFCRFLLRTPISKATYWDSASYSFTGDFDLPRNQQETRGKILVVGNDPEYIVVSDVDDTIMVSYSTQMARKVWLMLSRNALTRKPFPGVAAFYEALQKGPDGKGFNPIFYVSSSERNLYDLLTDFCEFSNIPAGPFMLRKMQKSLGRLILAGGGDHTHKFNKIKSLLTLFPELPFVLIGDSGQRDPAIYLRVMREYPGRVRAVYIREIRKKHLSKSLSSILEESNAVGTPMVFVKDTEEAAAHAVKHKLIRAKERPKVKEQKQKDLKAD